MRAYLRSHARGMIPISAQGQWDRISYVLRLAVPSAGEQLLSMVVGIVNTFLVGHLGAAPLAAVGLSNQWLMTAMILYSAVGTGSTALIARMVGAGDERGANRVLGQSLIIAIIAGLLSTIVLVIWAEPALKVMGATGDALLLGIDYLRTVSGVFLFASLMFIGNACLRGAGDTRTPLFVMLVVNAVNIGLSWTLVNGLFGLPKLGVQGAAFGEMSGRLIGGLLVCALLFRGRSGLRFLPRELRPEVETILRILRVGIPTGLEQLVFRFGMMSYVRVVAALGTVAYAAHQVALNAESLSYMPGFGFAVAATTLVGQGLGAKDEKRAEKDGYIAFGIAAGLMTLMGVCFFFFARPLVAFFTSDAEVIAQGVMPLRLIGLVQPFLAATMVFAGALRGAGETRTPMLVNGGSIWIVRVPLSLLFTQIARWGLTGAWIAMGIDLIIRGLLMYTRFRLGKWKVVNV